MLKTILDRRSIRAFTSDPVTMDQRRQILDAVYRSPTAGNMMLYSIIEVSDQQIKDQLVESCDHQPFIGQSPWVLLFLADYQRWFDFFTKSGIPDLCKESGESMRKPGPGDLMIATCDALIAAQTTVLAAESLGLGSCYIGDIMENYELHRKLFTLPRYTFPITLICLGHPTEQQRTRRPSRRFSEDLILHENQYQSINGHQLRSMEQELQSRSPGTPQAKSRFSNMAQRWYHRKFNAKFTREMSRSVRLIWSNWTESD